MSTQRYNSLSLLLSPGFGIALLVLILNDHVGKAMYPGWITGKLSDFAGLFCFPLFFTAFFPRYRMGIHIVTALGFLYWKLPLSEPVLQGLEQHLGLSVYRMLDASDLMALVMLPFSYVYASRYRYRFQPNRLSIGVLSVVALLAFAATSPSHRHMTPAYHEKGTRGFYIPDFHTFGFYMCRAKSDSEIYMCAENYPLNLWVALPDSVNNYPVPVYTLVDADDQPVSDLQLQFAAVQDGFGISYATEYDPHTSEHNRFGLLDQRGMERVPEVYTSFFSVPWHGDIYALHRQYADSGASVRGLLLPDISPLLVCQGEDSVLLVDTNFRFVARFDERPQAVLSNRNYLVTREGTRSSRLPPLGAYKKGNRWVRFYPPREHELDFYGTKSGIIDPKGNYLVPLIIDRIMYAGNDRWVLFTADDIQMYDAATQVITDTVPLIECQLPKRQLPKRVSLYQGEWLLLDQHNSRMARLPEDSLPDPEEVRVQYILDVWNADQQKNERAWLCLDADGEPIGIRKAFVPLSERKR